MTRFQYQNGDRPLEGYTIQYALGRGGFGEVYFAVSDAGRQVALKAVQNYEEIELRGIGHCMNLKSQHLVSIFDVRKGADGTPWVIMEFVSGPSLRDILDESPAGIGAEKAGFFVRELGKGLSYLHGAGVVHRDLKPHNVFFEEGIVKIGDYSLSKAITTSHRSGHTMTVGTVHYMAPEISMGRYDKTVDIYALGVMLYEMMTGSPPYSGDSMGEVLMKHLSAEPDVSKIQEPFASVIKKSMERDPANRYQTAEEMAAALHGVNQPADSMTGFGPLSLSMVAERQAKKVRPASEDSTGRIDAALTATQAEHAAGASDTVHPMRQLGRDLGGIAYMAAIVGDPCNATRDKTPADPVPTWLRRSLAFFTLPVISLVGGLMMLMESSSSWDQNGTILPAPFSRHVPIPDAAFHLMFVILLPSVMILLGAVIVRFCIERGTLPERPKRCRIAHAAVTFVLFGLVMMLGLSLIVEYPALQLVAVGVPLLIQNWCLLSSPTRRQRIRLWPVLFAAIIAFATAEILGADSMFAVAVVTGSALAVQVWARFSPHESIPTHGDRENNPAEMETQPPLAATQPPIHSLVTAE